MQRAFILAVVVLALAVGAYADCYAHMFRGSNNKLNEENRNTQNENRLFDSQNNAQGGYQWSPTLTYYSGSLMQIEWTSQHGCGQDHPNVDCNYVLQYMCGPWIGDGEKGDGKTPASPPAAGDDLRGAHEPESFYAACKTRSRNKGLFTADRNMNNNAGATATRQNPNGNNANNAHGYECPEERDYAPYWAPSPWIDIAYLTSNPGRCSHYRKESQNVKGKGICLNAGAADPPSSWDDTSVIPKIWTDQAVPWDQKTCQSSGLKWVVINSWGTGKPDCAAPAESRDNHLGNVYLEGEIMTNFYKWVIPNVKNNKDQKYATCVFRIRYNISSEDYLGFGEIDSGLPMVDASSNGVNSPVKNDPTVTYGMEGKIPRNLSLQIDTTQFGRTFQDRSHVFRVSKRPKNVPAGARIFNLNIRGRRGNIVQCYPAVEFNYVPTNVQMTKSDYLHFQWTGTDHNPANQAGGGNNGRDRHNLVFLAKVKSKTARANYPLAFDDQKLLSSENAYAFAHANQPKYCTDAQATSGETGCCLTDQQLITLKGAGNNEQEIQNCRYLNLAPGSFDGQPLKPKSTGTFFFMGTRANDFTNRSLKGSITVTERLPPVAIAGVAAGAAGFVGAAVIGGGAWYAKTHTSSAAANVFGGIKI